MLELELFKIYCIPDNVFSFMQHNTNFVGRAIQKHLLSNSIENRDHDDETDFGDIPEFDEKDAKICSKVRPSKEVNHHYQQFKAAKIKD